MLLFNDNIIKKYNFLTNSFSFISEIQTNDNIFAFFICSININLQPY